MNKTILSATAVAIFFSGAQGPVYAASQGGAAGVVVVSAQSYLDVIVMLEKAGYDVTGMKSTFLGRLKIRAQNRKHLREIVVSRSTGEIKSDRILKVFGSEGGASAAAPRPASSSNAASASGSGGISASAGTGGVSASVGSAASVNVGSGGVSANVGGISVGIGN